MKQEEECLPSKPILTVFVVFLDVWSAAVAKKNIDTEIYDKSFDSFVERVL